MNDKPGKPDPRQLILKQLRHPLKLRLLLGLSMIAGWYLLFFMPLAEDGNDDRQDRTRVQADCDREGDRPAQEATGAVPGADTGGGESRRVDAAGEQFFFFEAMSSTWLS